jgi:hypothetical protein
VVNVLAYARLFLEAPPGSQDAEVVPAMEMFCRAWAPVYDAVFYCPDHYGAQQGGDPFRAKVIDLQEDASVSMLTVTLLGRYCGTAPGGRRPAAGR